MKRFMKIAALAALTVGMASPALAQSNWVQLLSNGNANGNSFSVPKGAYVLSLPSAFGSSTISLTETWNVAGNTDTLWTGTVKPSTPPCIPIPDGVTVRVTVTGGTPSGLNVFLGSTGGACGGSSSGGGGGGDVTNAGVFAVQNTAATPAGANILGKISQVDSGGADATDTTNHAVKVNVVAGGAGGGAVTNAGTFAVQNNAATPAGTNLMGKVGIDQTTPGTTNAVQANAGTNLNTSALATSTNATETHGTVAAGTAATKAEAVGGVYNSSPITLTNTQGAALQLDANGYAKVNVAAGGAGGGAVYGPTANGSAAANPPVLMGGTATGAATGNVQNVKVDSNGNLYVSSGDTQGSTSSGEKLSLVGARSLSTTPTDTTAQTNAPVQNLNGAVVVFPYALPDSLVSGVITSAMTSTTTTSLIGAPSGSLHNYITQITCSNSHATQGTNVFLQDGSGGTTFYLLPAAAVYGGAVVTFPAPLRQPTAATALFVKDETGGANVECAASGFKAL